MSEAATETTEVEPIGSETSQAETTTEATEFDAAAFEAEFGFPDGHLKDCKSVEDVLNTVAQFTDRTLIAGLGDEDDADETPFPVAKPPKAPAAKPADPPADPPKGGSGNAEYDALKARLDLVEGELQASKKSQETALLAEVDRRLKSEIDSWASPKYGVGKDRNFKQTKDQKEVLKLVKTHIAGLAATGQPIPTVEVIARRVRAFHDDTYKPAAKKPAAAPLGTPGTAKDGKGGKDAPNSIHEALMQNPN